MNQEEKKTNKNLGLKNEDIKIINGDIHYRKAYELSKMGVIDEVISELELSIKNDYIPAYSVIAQCYQALGENKKMVQYLNTGAEKNCVRCINIIANHHKTNGNIDLMKKFYQQGIELGSGVCIYNLASYYLEIKDYDNMEKYLNMGIQIENLECIREMGLYKKSVGDVESAKTYFELACIKGCINSIYDLGLMYYIDKNYDQMEIYFNMGIELNHPLSLFQMFIHSFNQKNNDSMLEYLKLGDQKNNLFCKYILSLYYLLEEKNFNKFVSSVKNITLVLFQKMKEDINLTDNPDNTENSTLEYDEQYGVLYKTFLESSNRLIKKIMLYLNKNNFVTNYQPGQLNTDLIVKTSCCNESLSENIFQNTCPKCNVKFRYTFEFDISHYYVINNIAHDYQFGLPLVKGLIKNELDEQNVLTFYDINFDQNEAKNLTFSIGLNNYDELLNVFTDNLLKLMLTGSNTESDNLNQNENEYDGSDGSEQFDESDGSDECDESDISDNCNESDDSDECEQSDDSECSGCSSCSYCYDRYVRNNNPNSYVRPVKKKNYQIEKTNDLDDLGDLDDSYNSDDSGDLNN